MINFIIFSLLVFSFSMHIIITGCKGFLGYRVIQFLKDKYQITGVDLGQHENLGPIKIYSPEEILNSDIEADVVVMCHAAVSSGTYQAPTDMLFQSNVLFTEKLAQKFKNSYLLYISSVSVYGQQRNTWHEATPAIPDTPYAISKLWGEKIIATHPKYGILRLTSLYGIGMKENTIIPHYISQAINKGTIEVWGEGNRKQNYVYVDDVANYIEQMILMESHGIHIAAAASEINNAYLAEIISRETGSNIQFVYQDNSPSVSIDNTETRKKLQINFESDLAENIKKYIHWKQKQS